MINQLTFEDWFYARCGEGFGLRAEYFYDDVESENSSMRTRLMKEWLKEAFETGVRSAKENTCSS